MRSECSHSDDMASRSRCLERLVERAVGGGDVVDVAGRALVGSDGVRPVVGSPSTLVPCHHGAVRTVRSTDGIDLAVHDLGGDGPTVLFAHATGLHAQVWAPVARELRDFHAIAVDFRGHGRSAKPAEHRYEWRGFADDVLAVVDALDLGRPFGVGHSKGGAALLLAEEQRPGTFRALWCFDPVVFPPGRAREHDVDGNPLAAGAERRRAVFTSRDEALDRFRSKPPFDVVSDEALDADVTHGLEVRDDGSLALRCPPAVEAQVYRMGAAHRAFEHLDAITCPVTIARAAVDGIGPAAFAVVHRRPAAGGSPRGPSGAHPLRAAPGPGIDRPFDPGGVHRRSPLVP
ncbi:MAG: alpha/beta hydrolase [Acidimicrobiia bacterium]|nr:alpha/beta hydrolase [Acidimicrobiia bacterium]